MTESELRQALNKLPPEQRAAKMRSLAPTVYLAELRDAHMRRWQSFQDTGDETEWDNWLLRIGRAGLDVRATYDARSNCLKDTACGGCESCLYEDALDAQNDTEGSARGSRGLTSKWTDSQAIREGQHLHNWWAHGVKRSRAAKPEPSTRAPRGGILRRGGT